MLNPSQRSHHEKFRKVLDEQLDIYNIENEINAIHDYPTQHEMERINKLIIRVLNISQKKVEGINRNIPFSKEKEK